MEHLFFELYLIKYCFIVTHILQYQATEKCCFFINIGLSKTFY